MLNNVRTISPLYNLSKQALLVALIFCAPMVVLAQLPSTLNSDGVIYNTGTVKIVGDARLAQDTIGGVVRYERDNVLDTQTVAHVVYNDVHFEGASKKMLIDASKPLIADHLFWSIDSNVVFNLIQNTYIQANQTVVHEGIINPTRRFGRFVLRGTTNQDVSGKGLIPILELDNSQGATMTRTGGLRVVERLDLQRGLLSNSSSDNINMMRNGWIWRSDSGTIAEEPITDIDLNLRYYGLAPMVGGPEMVRSTTLIRHVFQHDTAGLTLPWDVYVKDSLVLRGHIFTEPSATVKHSLFYTSFNDPSYEGFWPEINGTMVRTSLEEDSQMMMNNQFTTIYFASKADMGSVTQYAVRSKPLTTPLPLTDIVFKAERFLQLTAIDSMGDKVPDSTYTLTFGYAWRNRAAASFETAAVIETTPALVGKEDSLVFMRHDGFSYNPYGFSTLPTLALANPVEAWRYSKAGFVRASGDFAIGLSTGPVWVLNTRIFLEGPMREYGDGIQPFMSTDLATLGLIPNVPPDIYPYSLNPDRLIDTALFVPDSIVDWITVEFRTTATASGPAALVETLLLTRDGNVLDPQTLRPRIIAGIAPGQYNLAVRHRNHLAVITEDKVLVDRSNIGFVVDISKGVGLLGGAAAQKLLGVTTNGGRLFGLIGGSVTSADNIIRTDYNLTWDNRDVEAYSLFDTNLNGIVNTRDANISWNNRNRLSVAPR